MKDGDPQQHNEIKRQMLNYLSNAADAACGWHIVHQGWKRHCPGVRSVPKEKEGAWKQVEKHIKAWIYSWMRPGYCECEEEYVISKELLFRYVSSRSVFEASGQNPITIKRVKDWIHLVTSSHAPVFLHYLRKDKRSFDTMCASAHEGTNHGLKSHSIPMKANASMTTTAKTLAMQAQLKTAELEQEAYRNVVKSNKVWSSLPTADHLPPYPEGLVHAVMDRDGLYDAKRVGHRQFDVTCNAEVEPYLADAVLDESPIPRFSRVRRVTIDDKGVCKCSSCYFERVGIPCPHIAAVFQTLDPDWKGFLHTDVSVRWWSQYHYHGYKLPSHGRLTKLFHELRKNDVSGPTIALSLVKGPVHQPSQAMIAVDRLKNYNKEDVSDVLGGTIDGCILATYMPDNSMSEEMDLLSAPLSLPDPAPFVESISDVAGAHRPGVGIRAALSGLINELIQAHESCKSSSLDEELASVLQDRLNIARKKMSDKLPASEKNAKTVAMLPDRQEGGHSRIYNTKIEKSM